MRAMIVVILVCCAVTSLQAIDLQNIQDAQPLNVDLSSQSDTALANIAGTEVDEVNLGGYRPLYPPYFPREPSSPSSGAQPKSVYYDQEYYTRGAHPGFTDDRLDRQLKIASGTNPFLPGTRTATSGFKPVTPGDAGAQPAIAADHTYRQIKIAAGTNPFLPSTRPAFPEARPVIQPVLSDDRNNRQIKITKSHFSHSASSSFSSSFSFSSIKFPSS